MIIWLASYPRSGNTFVRILLNKCFGKKSLSLYNDENDIEANDALKDIVGHQHMNSPWAETEEKLENCTEIHFVKTHDSPKDNNKTIYIVRDPRAVIASYKKYLDRYGAYDVTLNDIAAGAVGFGSWGEHFSLWAPNKRTDTLLLKYEEICADPSATIRAIAKFTGLKAKNDFKVNFSDLQKIDPNFFRTGSNQAHLNDLDDNIENLIQSLFQQQMSLLGYKSSKAPNFELALKAMSDTPYVLWQTRLAHHQVEREYTALKIAHKNSVNKIQELSSTGKALGKTTHSLNMMREKLARTEGKFEVAASELKDAQTRADERLLNENRLHKQIAGQTASLTSVRNNADSLKSQLQNKQEVLNNKNEELTNKDKKLTDLENQLHIIQNNCDTVQHDYNTSLQKIDENNINLTQLDNKITDITKKHAQSKIRADKIQHDFELQITATKKTVNEHDALKSNYKMKETALNKMTLEMADAFRIRKVLEKNQSTLQMSEHDLKQQLSKIKSTLKSTNAHLREIQNWTSPRWRTIATLRPLRFVLNQRKQLKSGEISLTGDELILPTAMHDHDKAIEQKLAPSKTNNVQSQNQVAASRTSFYHDFIPKKPLGIAVFTYDRIQSVETVLESLKLQNALANTHVWIDGDQGRPARRKQLDLTEAAVRNYEVAAVHRNRGNYGFRKMIIVALRKMFETYEHVLILEDDCFPNRFAAKGFSCELDDIENDEKFFSAYGHHFGVPTEKNAFGRFQGWGWATTREKIAPIWNDLESCYLMTEAEYLAFVTESMTPEISQKIDITLGRNPSQTLTKFFAWDETVCLLSALHGKTHRPSRERLVYNFGLGADSTHFGDYAHFRKPPFNMVSRDEIWKHF